MNENGAVKEANVESHRMPKNTLSLRSWVNTASALITNKPVVNGGAKDPSHAMV